MGLATTEDKQIQGQHRQYEGDEGAPHPGLTDIDVRGWHGALPD